MGEEGVVFSSAGVKVLSIYGVSEQSCPALQRVRTHTHDYLIFAAGMPLDARMEL